MVVDEPIFTVTQRQPLLVYCTPWEVFKMGVLIFYVLNPTKTRPPRRNGLEHGRTFTVDYIFSC